LDSIGSIKRKIGSTKAIPSRPAIYGTLSFLVDWSQSWVSTPFAVKRAANAI